MYILLYIFYHNKKLKKKKNEVLKHATEKPRLLLVPFESLQRVLGDERGILQHPVGDLHPSVSQGQPLVTARLKKAQRGPTLQCNSVQQIPQGVGSRSWALEERTGRCVLGRNAQKHETRGLHGPC